MADLNVREFPVDVLRDAKTFAASKGWTLKHVVCSAVREYLERQIGKGSDGPCTEGQRSS